MSRQYFLQRWEHIALALPLVVMLGCRTAVRTGEIEVYKITPTGANGGAGKEETAYLLKARGFSVGENSFRLSDAFGGYSAVSASDLKAAATALQQEAYKSLLKRRHAPEDPETRALKELHEKITDLEHSLPQPEPYEVAVRGLLKDVQEILTETETIAEVYGTLRHNYEKTDRLLKFPYTFRAGGQSLQRDRDYVKRPIKEPKALRLLPAFKTKPGAPEDSNQGKELRVSRDPGRIEYVSVSTEKGTAFGEMETRMLAEILELNAKLSDVAHTEAQATNLIARYRELVEYGLNFSLHSIDHDTPLREVYRLKNGETNELEVLSVRAAFDRTLIAAEAVRINAKSLLTTCRDLFGQSSANQQDRRLELEAFSRELADKTGGQLFHPILQASDGKPPTLVTFELRTLYFRALGRNEPDSKQGTNTTPSRLLVTCAVKNNENAQDAVYPVIYEEDYAPTHFVNRKDRIIYGPTPYNGHAFDVRFTVMELSGITSDQLSSAIGSATSVISLANPELAAISPVVTAFFSKLIEGIDFDRKEFDVSFSLPQPSAKNKSNTRFMVSETGHYILLKKENTGRHLGDEESKRQLFRNLVYNEEDGCLYRRVALGNAADNFKPENLFLDQSYAVIVVTDQDSDESDKLGSKLRQQVSQSLGAARAKQFIPDIEETRRLISRFMIATGRTNRLSTVNPDLFATMARKMKDELWSDAADAEKAFIVDTLLSRSDDAVRLQLGTNPDKWKNAAMRIDSDGVIHFADATVRGDQVFLPEQANQLMYPFGVSLPQSGLRYLLEDNAGIRSTELNGIGSINDSGQLQLKVELGGNLMSPYVTAVAFDPIKKSAIDSTKYAFVGFPFSVISLATNGTGVKERFVTLASDAEVDLILRLATPEAYLKTGFSVTLDTNQVASEILETALKVHLAKTERAGTNKLYVVPIPFHKLFWSGNTNGVPVQAIEIRRPGILEN